MGQRCHIHHSQTPLSVTTNLVAKPFFALGTSDTCRNSKSRLLIWQHIRYNIAQHTRQGFVKSAQHLSICWLRGKYRCKRPGRPESLARHHDPVGKISPTRRLVTRSIMLQYSGVTQWLEYGKRLLSPWAELQQEIEIVGHWHQIRLDDLARSQGKHNIRKGRSFIAKSEHEQKRTRKPCWMKSGMMVQNSKQRGEARAMHRIYHPGSHCIFRGTRLSKKRCTARQGKCPKIDVYDTLSPPGPLTSHAFPSMQRQHQPIGPAEGHAIRESAGKYLRITRRVLP